MIDQKPPMPPARQDMPADRYAVRRAALLTEMTARDRVPGRRRLAFAGLATAALAGAAAVALIAVPDAGDGGSGGPTAVKVVPVSAVQVLDHAAARADQAAEPRPDQYVYTEAEERGLNLGDVIRSKSWRSVSGERVGLSVDSGDKERSWICEAVEPKQATEIDPAKVPGDCQNGPFYRRDLPEDAQAMRAWLYEHSPTSNPPDVRAFSYVHEIVSGSGLTPAAQAAIFKAASTIPGVTVSDESTESIAVGQTWRNVRHELLFEPGTYRFLGTRQVVDHDRSFQPEGGKPDTDPGADNVDAKGMPRNSAFADDKQGTVIGQWMIVSQQVVDTIPAEYFNRAS
ncbi:CU044_5270 family protein [Nonomuraea guangzhouensis]|uniref:CU044_5270 family protein n=1 Tax=Nonomuraea guangzhouensis TaxID=1291555 RepID=A0ABW4GC25_9ACTN|nr:CU044_5270 family protein [Nonomuraea guangzhouensis]